MTFYLLSEGLTYDVYCCRLRRQRLMPLCSCVGIFSGAYESLKVLSRVEKGVDTDTLAAVLEFWFGVIP
jgi:hypothetical protein